MIHFTGEMIMREKFFNTRAVLNGQDFGQLAQSIQIT